MVLNACVKHGNLCSLNLSHNSLMQGDNTQLSKQINTVTLSLSKQPLRHDDSELESPTLKFFKQEKTLKVKGRKSPRQPGSGESSCSSLDMRSKKRRPSPQARGQPVCMEEEFMLAIQSGKFQLQELLEFAKILSNQ